MELDLIRRLSAPNTTKVLLCVLDGLGGMPGPRGRTELEEAHPRHLDRLAEEGTSGQTIPVGYGTAGTEDPDLKAFLTAVGIHAEIPVQRFSVQGRASETQRVILLDCRGA